MAEIQFFTKELMLWFDTHARDLPWKQNKDPYSIWLSEIILQQTRVDQGTPYYIKFINQYPTIKEFALADIDAIMHLWQGLGYYSRARNMHHTAQYIYKYLNGIFPSKYDDLLQLKGIGPYTAAAIMSFAYDKVYPVVDGNVIRVISRYFGITDYVDDPAIIKYIYELAHKLINRQKPGHYNQAIMDFGAGVCKPKIPKCDECIFQSRCEAYQFKKVDIIPSKSKKLKRRNRYFHYFILNDNGRTLIQKRQKKDIWQELYQFPLLESTTDGLLTTQEIKSFLNTLDIYTFDVNKSDQPWYKQLLTHQFIRAKFYHINVNEAIILKSSSYYLVETKNFENFAFPKIINSYIESNDIVLKSNKVLKQKL